MANSSAVPTSHRLWRRLVWPVLVAALIVVASSRSRVSGPDIPHLDKVTHFAVYGLLGTLLCRVGTGARAAVGAVLLASVFGASDEWHQSFVPGRTAEFADWVADTLGAVVGAVAYTRWTAYRCWLERPLGGRGRGAFLR
jgi:VanZ family protein